MKKNILKQIIAVLMVGFIAVFGFLGKTSQVQATSTGPFETEVNIHMIETSAAPKEMQVNELQNPITNLTDWFGEGAKGLQGVVFDVYKVEQSEYEKMVENSESYDTKEKVESFIQNKSAQRSPATDAEGHTKVTLGEGYYWVIQKPLTTIATYTAVPFGLTLPYTNSEGTGNLSEINVYPKNILVDELPTVSKSLDTASTINGSQYIGQQFGWTVTSDVPKGIGEYSVYKFTDKLNEGLDYVDLDMPKELGLIEDEDYQVDYDSTSRNLTLTINKNGIKNLINIDTIKFNIVTKMNKEAVPGTPIKNTISLTYQTPHTNGAVTITPNTTSPANVVTGGHKFKKTIDTEDGDGLPGAKFVVQNDSEQFVIQNSESQISFTTNPGDATEFISSNEGTFEVNGLAFGNYTLVEVKAPEGYALPTNPKTSFTVSENSHSNTTTIVNKKITIPQTGGMGTILFTIVGLGLMIFAIVYYKKTNQA